VVDKHYYKEIGILLVVSIILVGGFLLLREFGAVSVGQAVYGGAQGSAEGSKYTSDKCENNKFTKIESKIYNSKLSSNKVLVGCCDSLNYCFGPIMKDVNADYSPYCYSEGSILNGNDQSPAYCAKSFNNQNYVWLICNALLKNMLMEENNVLCDGEKWIICENSLNLQLKGDYVCADTKWYSCDDNCKKSCDSKNVNCNFNVHEGSLPGLLGLTNVNNILKASTSTTDAVDVGQNKAIYGVIKKDETAFFKYNGNFYTVKMTEGAEESSGKYTLSVSSLKQTLGIISEKLLDNKGTPYFEPVQMALDLDKDKKTDAYLNLVAGSPLSGQAMFVVTPYLNFDSEIFSVGNSIGFFSSGNTQTFNFGGEHTFYLNEQAGSFVLVIDKGEYNVNQGQKGTHYLDEMKTKKVSYESLLSSGKFSLVQFSTAKDYISVFVVPEKNVLLKDAYEAYFDDKTVLNIEDKMKDPSGNEVAIGTIGICENDPKVLNVMTVCDKKTEIFDLVDKEVEVRGEVLFLYNSPAAEGKKQGKAYHIINLDNEKDLSVEELAVNFANNLVDGKSVVVKSQEEYYLLSTEKANYLDLNKLKLKRLGKDKEAEFLPEGDNSEVAFNLPLGKQISVVLITQPKLSYILSSKIVQKETVNLENELQTRMSTYSSREVKNPNLGTIKIDSASDIKLLKDTMKISIVTNSDGTSVEKKEELLMNVPVVVSSGAKSEKEVLMLYNKFSVDGKSDVSNTYAKYADIYLYANITDKVWEHEFNSENFILPLVKGNKAAFGLEGKYYLLSYSVPWTGKEADGFEIEKMQITDLSGKNPALLKSDSGKYFFDLGENQIGVIVDTIGNKIKFDGKKKAELTAQSGVFQSSADFSAILLSGLEGQEVHLNVNGIDYQICDEGDIKQVKSQVYLCYNLDNKDNKKQMKLGEEDSLMDKSGNKVIYRYQGVSEGRKRILFQHLFDLNSQNGYSLQDLSWTEFSNKLDKKKYPLLGVNWKLGERKMELRGGKDLEDFELVEVKDNVEVSYPIVMQSELEASENGTIVVEGRMIFFQKELKDAKILLDISLLNDNFISDKGLNVTTQQSADQSKYSGKATFVATIGGESYAVEIEKAVGGKLVKILIYKNDAAKQTVLNAYLPTGKEKEVLLTNGNVVKIKIMEDSKKVPVLQLSK
jgi:hypothetical protein